MEVGRVLGEETRPWGLMENGSQKQHRWDLRRGELCRRDVKKGTLGNWTRENAMRQTEGRAGAGTRKAHEQKPSMLEGPVEKRLCERKMLL